MKKSLLILMAISIAGALYARKPYRVNRPVTASEGNSRAADCAPANERIFLEFNNIRALVETGGLLWQDRANDHGSYEYPKGSGNYLLYSGALWMGGVDFNGQLSIAAHLFRQTGNDFWAGPLRDLNQDPGNFDPFVPQNADVTLYRPNGAGIINKDECAEYDKFYTIRKSEVRQFIAWWNCEYGPSTPEECEGVVKPNEEVMQRIIDWPAHGNKDIQQDYYLAPFYDNAPEGGTGNGEYHPIADGDYPWYDIAEEISCKNDRRVTLYGDETHWWVFNDKGNIHTETGGEAIGMEIRAQAFSFATDDEVNDMTFYNYELINRGTQTLYETYFGQFADPDIGASEDDFAGCDVSRGLGYVYNADPVDEGGEGGQPGYGPNIPAVGIDFFEGPYLDNDGLDNPLYKTFSDSCGGPTTLAQVAANNGIPYAGLGIGYGDCVVDNERFGMQRFVYFDRLNPVNFNDPESPADFYNYMRGIWKNNSEMEFGDTGFPGSSGVPTKYMYPDDSDPLGWGTYPVAAPDGGIWKDQTPGDKRFVQSAGPFTLAPGAVNNITVGVVVGQSNENDLEAPVRALKKADSKAQALFDNCFELIDPPFAPVLTIQEMENELLLFLTDPPGPDALEDYVEEDYRIDTAYSDNKYRFEGFQIYQMVDADASVTDIGDLSKARLVGQSDVKNGVGKMINYTYDDELDISIPAVMVEPAGGFELDGGLRRSFRVTEDLFATGSRTLVNHKKYYYIAVSYGYNQYLAYDPTNPALIDGQKQPYLRSRITGFGKAIESQIGIPHDPTPEADGRIFTTSYGHQPEITQIEGLGNGGTFLELNQVTHDEILSANTVKHPTYASGSGPVAVKVIDPLSVKGGEYTIGFTPEDNINDSEWWIERNSDGIRDTVYSQSSINVVREQLILDWGISVSLNQQEKTGITSGYYVEPIGSSISFEDSSLMWLSFVEDSDDFYPSNWILTGSSDEYQPDDDSNPQNTSDNWIYQPGYYDDNALDESGQFYEQLLDGGIGPFKFVAKGPYGSPFGFPDADPNTPTYKSYSGWFGGAGTVQNQISLEDLHDVDIVITKDKSKWTRCPVIEISTIPNQTEHGDQILQPRSDASVDKQGLSVAEGGVASEANLTNDTGMGWFPGYAIDVNTGKRLNMMFAENSWLLGDNGDDMIWNPTSSYNDKAGVPIFGGMHYVYVFSADEEEDYPAYDEGKWLRERFNIEPGEDEGNNGLYSEGWKSCMWVMAPLLTEGQELLATDVKISARVKQPYKERLLDEENNGFPLYQFGLDNPSVVGDGERLVSVIDRINVVPNPYYAYSEYETAKRDNRIKITNLPERCEVTIFNMQGALVRSYIKDDPLTSLDWDLKNHQNIPIAGGVYIIHIKMDIEDENGMVAEHEKILKWYGVLRTPDLDNL